MEMEINEYRGISVESILKRENRRWTLWVLAGPWLNEDLRAELEDGMAFVLDKQAFITNGVYLTQVKYNGKENE